MSTTKRYFLVDGDKNVIRSSDMEFAVDVIQLNEKPYYITRHRNLYGGHVYDGPVIDGSCDGSCYGINRDLLKWRIINESYDERHVVILDLPYSNSGEPKTN